jgi:hypothetical protein
LSGNNLYIIAQGKAQNTLGSTIWFIKSTDDGTTFGTPIDISNTSNADFPKIAVSGMNIYVAWRDTADVASGNSEIFFSKY